MEKVLGKMLKYPKTLLILLLIITAVFFRIIQQNARMETDLDKFMPQNHPAFIYSDKMEKVFDIKDGIIIAIENRGNIYNYRTLKKIKDLTKALGKMPEIEKSDITSLYTADNIIGTDDGMDVKAFYKRVPKNQEKLNTLQKELKNIIGI